MTPPICGLAMIPMLEAKLLLHKLPADMNHLKTIDGRLYYLTGYIILILLGGKSDLNKHAKSSKHERNWRSTQSTPTLQKLMAGHSSLDKDRMKAELLFTCFQAEHNIAMLAADHAGPLFRAMFPGSDVARVYACARTKATALVNHALAPEFHDPVVECMQTQSFSLLMDETTDISVEKQACLMVRYFDDGVSSVVTKFYQMVTVNTANAQNLYDAVRTQFETDNVSFSNLLGFGSDGASVMLGRHNSVVTRLKREQPNLYNIHCLCHIAHLCASDAVKKLPAQIEELAQDIYAHFHMSAKRIEEYQEFQHFCEIEPHKLLKPSVTRWLSLEQVVNRVLEQWPALSSYFQSCEERSSRVVRVTAGLLNPINKCYYQFLSALLPLFNRFNVLFQSSKVNIHLVHAELHLFLKNFLGRFVKPVEIVGNNPTEVDYLDSSVHLHDNNLFIGWNTRQTILSEDLEGESCLKTFFTNVRAFYIESCNQIIRRFPVNDPVLEGLTALSPSKRQNSSVNSILSLAARFPQIVDPSKLDDLASEYLDYQHLPLSEHLLDETQTPVDVFWHNMAKRTCGNGEVLYPVLSKLMKTLLCLPHGNADCERIFSHVQLIKTKTRNRMGLELLNSLLTVKCNKPFIDCFELIPSEKMYSNARRALSYLEQGKTGPFDSSGINDE